MISIWSIRPNPEGAEKNKKRKIEKIVKVPHKGGINYRNK